MSDAPTPTDPLPADKARLWADTIAAFATSGLSVRAFCAARGLEEKRFYTWRRNLGLSPVARPAPVSDAPARPFVPVRVVSDTVAEVGLPDGVTLRVPVSADPAHVARLVAALRGGAC
ncbi:MAG: hypothetical protein U0871_01285 [Gemmataceae bacterium]